MSFTDGGGNTESLTSTATGSVANVNEDATGKPTITGAATNGQTLTANQGTIADADGLPGGSFPSGYTFQWNRGGTAITGATSRTYTLVGDDVGETITVTVSFTDGGGNTESLTSAATAQVDAVTVRFKESAHEVEEGDAATLTLQLSGSLANAETISVSLTAITATGNGVDFDNSAKQVSIPSGTTEKTFDVTTVQDSLVEQDETFRATILSFNLPAGVARGTPHTSDVTILDDDNTAPTGAPTIAGTAAVGETLTANRGTLADADGLPSTTFPEGYAFQWRRGGTDIAGATSRTYTLVAADAGGTITVAVSYTDNYGNTETVVSAATASVDAGTTEHTLTLSLAPGEPSTVDEGDDPVELVIGGTPALGDYTLFVTLGLGGTAAAGADYTLEYEVNPGEWQSVAGAATPRFDMNALPAKLRVTAVDDGAAEGGETITVTLAETPDRFQFGYSCPITPDDPSGCLDEHGVDQSVPPPNTYAVGTASSVSLTIRPSEGPPNAAPTVDNEIPDQSATAGQAFGFTFAANAFSDPDGDALTYTAVKRDGAALPAWLTFAPGARAFSGTPGAGDAGTVSVKVTASDPGGLSAEDTFDIAVTAPPPVTPAAGFASAASSAGEGAGTRNVAVGFSPAPQSAITLAYTVGGTATAGTDFSIANSGSVSVSANATSVNIPVAITDDADEEPNETVVLTLAGGTGYTLGSANVHTLTITDNDDPPPDTPVVSISGGPAVTEGGNAAFTLTASPAPAGNISVRVSVAGGSFAASGARTVTVGASGTASLTVATVDDAADEPDGAVRATVQSGTGYAPHNTNASASVTVLDNDDSGDPGPDPDPDPDPDTGSGGSGGGSVADAEPELPALTVQQAIAEGETTYKAGDREVTVRREPGTPAVRFAVPESAAEDATITVSPVAGDVPLGPGAFALGPPEARTLVDVAVDRVPADGLTLCLPVTPALLEAAAGRPLILLRYADGAWNEVPGSAFDEENSMVCATVTGFSPFAVGFRAPPGAPADLAVGGATPSSLEVNWTAPGDTGARLNGYELQYRPAGAETWTDHPHADLSTSATLGGLAPDTDYEVRARSLGDGESEWAEAAGRTAPLDGTASRTHLFPLFADGGGFRTRLYLTDVSGADNRCGLSLHGPGLGATAFENHPALTASADGVDIDLDPAGDTVALTTAGEGNLVFGYAKLACERPAVARMLLTLESGGETAALTNLESVRAMNVFQFPAMPRLGRLGLVLANDNELEAACALEAADAEGAGAGGARIAVPARSTEVRFLDELAPMEQGAADGTARVTCDRPVAALGVPLHGGDFAALAGVDLESAGQTTDGAADPADSGGESRFHRVLPLVQDGGGFRSSLVATNLSDAANSCTLRFDLPGVPSAKFQRTPGVTWEDARTAAFELAAGPGGQLSLPSLDRSPFVSFGYAALDCDAPADIRNLLTASAADGPAGVADMAPVQAARTLRFPVPPGLGSFALVMTNAAEAGASCGVELTLAGRQETLAAESPVRIESASTEIRFLADLFELPGDFPGGGATLRCDRNVAAVALPATAGAAFTAVPPVVGAASDTARE
ncbi:MAG: hypothetical protein F4Y89_10445 [Gammaproteobacteria bacterium]|nr:hypothetical protein [Gammaproteobacteria bacterium]